MSSVWNQAMLIPRFDYMTYLVLARELADCSSVDQGYQAKVRSAISRAYYAVYLHAWQARGINDNAGRGDVIAWLRQINSNWGQDAAELKNAREDCDYDHAISYDVGNKAQECIDNAFELFDRISKHNSSS